VDEAPSSTWARKCAAARDAKLKDGKENWAAKRTRWVKGDFAG